LRRADHNMPLNRILHDMKLRQRWAAFLVFHLVFSFVMLPLFVFYGPFDTVKGMIVGASWNSFRHQYIARFFLSDEAIDRILEESTAIDPTSGGERIRRLRFGATPTDRIDLYTLRGKTYQGKLLVIHDPRRIQVGYSEHLPRTGEATSSIARRNEAVAAINGGGFMDRAWAGTGGEPMGLVMHAGKMIHSSQVQPDTKQDVIAFDREGMLIVGKHSVNQLKEYGVQEAVSFGPPLLVNGKSTITRGDGGWGIAPRTAIGQTEDGRVLLLAIDGRNLHSVGATLRDVQDVLKKYGAVNAANLDGGSSTTMVLNGSIINKPSDVLGERAVSTAFLVIPAKEGDN
jgi:exopolysaccharide biosynthesis protein